MPDERLQVGDTFRCKKLAGRPSGAGIGYSFDIESADEYQGDLEDLIDRQQLVIGQTGVTFFRTLSHPDDPTFTKRQQESVDLRADDLTRGHALFVVEHTEMSGGGTGHGPNDYYPDGWGVWARRLNDDGSYNPDGETVFFRQSGSYNNVLAGIEKVGRMQMTFVEPDHA